MLYTSVIIVPWSNNNSVLESLYVKILAALPFVKYQFPNWGQNHDRPNPNWIGSSWGGGGLDVCHGFLVQFQSSTRNL